MAKRYGFWLLALLRLPAGIAATAMARFAPGRGPSMGPEAWLLTVVLMAAFLVVVAPCGLPLALGCRRLWRLDYRCAA